MIAETVFLTAGLIGFTGIILNIKEEEENPFEEEKEYYLKNGELSPIMIQVMVALGTTEKEIKNLIRVER